MKKTTKQTEEEKNTTMQLPQWVKDKMEEKRKELKLANVGAVAEKLIKFLDKLKG
jgi:hypothetical protein